MNERIVIEIKLPVGVSELKAVVDALTAMHGSTLFMRQQENCVALFKLMPETKDKPE